MSKFSLVVITLNEEKNIEACIKAVETADEVIVVDSGSTDKTVEISKSLGARVINQEWLGYGRQKQFAISQAKNDWVLLLDADEFVNKELLKSIDEAMSQNYFHAYKLPIKEMFMGKVLSYGRGYCSPIRFHRKSSGRINDKEIHEGFETEMPVGKLKGFAVHHSATTAIARVEKIIRDAKLEKKHNSAQVSESQIFWIPFKYFFVQLIKRKAYKDGVEGIILSMLYTFQMFIQLASFYENKKGY